MHCSVCYSDLEPHLSPVLPCSCTSCSDCLTQWILTQTQELHFQTNEKVLCMNENCRKLFGLQDVLLQLTPEQQTMVNAALFDVYLRKTSDIRMCPNNECNYAGMINTTSACKDNLECAKCGVQWKEKIHYSTMDKAKEFIVNNSSKRSEALCELWEEMFARRCPRCDVSIQKSGGCDHMTCKKCQYEFCWVCSQRFNGHVMTFCAMASVIKIIIVAIAVVNLLWMVGIVQLVLCILGWTFRFVIRCVLLNMIVGGMYFLWDLRKKKRYFVVQVLGVFYIIGLWGFTHFHLLYFDLLRVALAEAGLVGAFILYDRRMKRWFLSTY